MKNYLFPLLTVLAVLYFSNCKKSEDTSTNKGTCTDGIINQDETGIDCGGSCATCETCSDNIQNQTETDVDCGGPCGPCPATYPQLGKYGPNLLRLDTITLKGTPSTSTLINHFYSIAAEIEKGVKLTIAFTSLKSDPCSFILNGASMTGWKTNNLTTGKREFYVSGKTSADMQIYMCGAEGSLKVEYYINDATKPIRTKILTWAP